MPGQTIFARVASWAGFLLFMVRTAFGHRPPIPFENIRDDPAVGDNYCSPESVGRRVFVSYERSAKDLASAFASALETRHLVAWRYEPNESPPETLLDRTRFTLLEQVESFQANAPELARKLEATIHRSDACIFLVSKESLESALCQVEALATFALHSVWKQQAPVYVIRENEEVTCPVFLSGFWNIVYEPGVEEAIAEMISKNIETHRIRRGFLDGRSVY